MKKPLALLAVFAVLLAGCTPPPAATSASSAPIEAETLLVQAPATGHQFGELQDVMGTGLGRAVTDEGVYEILPISGGLGLMTYMDFAKGTQRALCEADACEHDSAACPAVWPSGTAQALVAGDTLMVYTYDMETRGGTLWALAADGVARRVLLHMPAEQSITGLLADGECLLATLHTTVTRPTGQPGVVELVDEWSETVCIDLATGEVRAFALPEGLCIIGAHGTQLVVSTGAGWGEENTYSLLDPVSGELRELAVVRDVLTQYGAYLVGIRGEQYVDWELYVLRLADGGEQCSVPLDAYFNIYGHFDGVLYCMEMDEYFRQSPVKIDLETGARRPAQMNRFDSVASVMVPLGAYKGSYVVPMGMRRYTYTDAEAGGEQNGWQLLYGLVDRQSFDAGGEGYGMLQWLPMPG